MLSIGALIWVSFRPLLRLVICAGCGFVITKADIFPLVAARGTGQIMLNIALPSLMFSKIVPAFTPDNIKALGPLTLVAIIYELLGIFIAWIVKQFFWVPHRFRYGILVAGGWGNYGDIPTSVIMSITGSAPFNGTSDQTLSVAYISAFILIFFVTLFPMGGHRLIALDYVGPEVEDDDVRMSMVRKTKQSGQQFVTGLAKLRTLLSCCRSPGQKFQLDSDTNGDIEKLEKPVVQARPTTTMVTEVSAMTEKDDCTDSPYPPHLAYRRHNTQNKSKHVAFHADEVTVVQASTPGSSRMYSPAPTEYGQMQLPSRVTSPTPTHIEVDPASPLSSHSPDDDLPSPSSLPRPSRLKTTYRFTRTVISSLLTPPAISILIAFPIALITPLKALFVPIPNSPIPNAPDGQPPLAFVLDTTTFIGGASVPLGLICLGSALARLKLPRGATEWKALPYGAINGLAIGKMLVMPVLGVLITQGLVSCGMIGKEEHVLRFVCIFFSCVPTATTQVFLTQVYSGTGEADVLSAFLIPQYVLMFISMTTLTAYSLSIVF